jgi:hypothetical protein
MISFAGGPAIPPFRHKKCERLGTEMDSVGVPVELTKTTYPHSEVRRGVSPPFRTDDRTSATFRRPGSPSGATLVSRTSGPKA